MCYPQVTLEVLSYHATAPLEEAVKLSRYSHSTCPLWGVSYLCRQKVPSASALQLHSFQFDDFGLEDGDTLKVSQFM